MREVKAIYQNHNGVWIKLWDKDIGGTMKRKTTVTTEEFNEDGTLKSRTTEVTEEEDTGYIYPQTPWWTQTQPYQPTYTDTGWPRPRPPYEITCDATSKQYGD